MNISFTKIHVPTPNKSIAAQNKAFELGWKWKIGGGTLYQFVDSPFLYFDGLGFIRHGLDKDIFISKDFREIFLNDTEFTEINKISNENKVLIGYKVKAGIKEEAAFRAIGVSTDSIKPRNCDFAVTSLAETKAIDCGLLDILFDRVYKVEELILNIPYLSERGTNELLRVIIERNNQGTKLAYYRGEEGNFAFAKQDLEEIIRPITPRTLTTKFAPVAFNIGCSGQYKNVRIEDIQKVINALK